ncbi:hypothetical protein CEXT_123021 [Caerostris extrusa]|uniref:Uncharacterized protein n=1 Tax=Caerostris extrusa TaxID=172846 RepID=A0AAV4PR88_CAEEX|nr:hypothetical protein CEXT_123021 [Caerostris extrusa]
MLHQHPDNANLQCYNLNFYCYKKLLFKCDSPRDETEVCFYAGRKVAVKIFKKALVTDTLRCWKQALARHSEDIRTKSTKPREALQQPKVKAPEMALERALAIRAGTGMRGTQKRLLSSETFDGVEIWEETRFFFRGHDFGFGRGSSNYLLRFSILINSQFKFKFSKQAKYLLEFCKGFEIGMMCNNEIIKN